MQTSHFPFSHKFCTAALERGKKAPETTASARRWGGRCVAAAGTLAWLLIIQEPIYDKHWSLPLYDKAYGSTEAHYPKKKKKKNPEHCGRRGRSRVHTHKRTLWGCLHNPAVLLADFLPRRHFHLAEAAADVCSFNMASGCRLQEPGAWRPLPAVLGTASGEERRIMQAILSIPFSLFSPFPS